MIAEGQAQKHTLKILEYLIYLPTDSSIFLISLFKFLQLQPKYLPSFTS
jgi:hypothetical protein